jgi:hypothetical protein
LIFVEIFMPVCLFLRQGAGFADTRGLLGQYLSVQGSIEGMQGQRWPYWFRVRLKLAKN